MEGTCRICYDAAVWNCHGQVRVSRAAHIVTDTFKEIS